MKESINNRYWVKVEVLSPLHIGAGQETDLVRGIDYITNDNKIYVLDYKKLREKCGGDEAYVSLMMTANEDSIKRELGSTHKNLEDCSSKVHVCSITSSANDIKTFLKNGLTNKPLLAGSSLKGAISSALFNHLVTDGLKEQYRSSKNNRDNFKLTEQVFGNIKDGNNFMRHIKVADCGFDTTGIVNTKIFNLYSENREIQGGWKKGQNETKRNFSQQGFNTLYECVMPGETSYLSISLANAVFNYTQNKLENSKKKDIVEKKVNDALFKIVNKYTKIYIEKEIEFFEEYENNETPHIIDSLNNIKEQIPEDNSSCILKMSAGAGFHSISGDWKFDDYLINGFGNRSRGLKDDKESAKSRKVAVFDDKYSLMGFVKLTLVPEDEAKKAIVKFVTSDAEEKIKNRQAKLEESQRKEKERKEQEQKEREAKEREEKERQKRIDREELRKEEEAKKAEKNRENNLKKEQQKNEVLLSKGLSELKGKDDFNKYKKKIADYFKALDGKDAKQEDLDYLFDFIKSCAGKSNKRWKKQGKGDWGFFKKLLSPELLEEWYKKIIK